VQPSAVVISGDLTYKARDSGFEDFKRLLKDYSFIWPDRSNVVVVPGNHDVVWKQLPATRKRYEGFIDATRSEGCATPLLDGIDFFSETGTLKPGVSASPHIVADDDFIIIPINSSNFCGVFVDRLDCWTRSEWERALTPLGAGRNEALEQLDSLRQHDMARVSQAQIEALGHFFNRLKISAGGDGRVRIAVIHHQLLPVSTHEERKTFESLSNLGLVRQMLRDYEIDVVLHGHKHESALFWDFLRSATDDLSQPARRTLVSASPGHFDVYDPVMRAFHFDGNAQARNLRVVRFTGPVTSHGRAQTEDEAIAPIWVGPMEQQRETERCLIRGGSASIAYSRLRSFFLGQELETVRNLVCQVDDPGDAQRLPQDYPALPDGIDRDSWLKDLVAWWQLDWSELIHRKVLSFNHGERIYSRHGDQVQRAALALNERKASSRAIIVLIHPAETGRYEKDTRDPDRGSYPAFALAEFALTERDDRRELDCFGYFRKQEMQYWWPVNLAELAVLQAKVAEAMRYPPRLGRITTFAGIAVWDDALPTVAVPELDRLVDSPERLQAVAAAILFPREATDQARSDWKRVLLDLADQNRAEPARPRLGHTELLSELQRLQAVTGARTGWKIVDQVADLADRYEAIGDSTPNAAARKLLETALQKLDGSVRHHLSNK
jgi:3',5'-cyclic AMP phosphodiesterase CpdA